MEVVSCTRPAVQAVGDGVEFILTVDRKVGAFWQILSQQPVGVFAGAAPAGVSRRLGSLSAGLLAIAPADVDAVIEGARRQRVKKAAVLASIASSTFERGWVNEQRDPDDEQL
ncbi:hypothetical protein HDG32_001466 [Paraburkholderia sp. CI2]|nr:hypothetical protein [Paraburkholderia sp. CI2]